MAIDGTRYEPAEVRVKPGTRVEWRNADPFPHTVTAPGRFDSGAMNAGARWAFVPTSSGRYDYICTLHPNMKGTLVVE